MQEPSSFSEADYFERTFSPVEQVDAVATALLKEGCDEGLVLEVLDSERTSSEIVLDLFDDVWDDFVYDTYEEAPEPKELTVMTMVAQYVIARAYAFSDAEKYQAILSKINV